MYGCQCRKNDDGRPTMVNPADERPAKSALQRAQDRQDRQDRQAGRQWSMVDDF
jgi:hypothetical protein